MDGYYGNEHEDIVFEMNQYERQKKLSRLKNIIRQSAVSISLAIGLGTIVGFMYANINLKSELSQIQNEYKIAMIALNDITEEYENIVNEVYIQNTQIVNNDLVNTSVNDTVDDLHAFDDWNSGDEVVEFKGVEIPWYLNLVNYENPISDNFKVELKDLNNIYIFDARASDYLDKMIADAKQSGLNPVICSSYRNLEKQTTLFYNYLNELLASGYCYEDAFMMAKRTNATPGNSEHHLGLAVDIMAADYGTLDEGLENTLEFKWLKANCAKYGFILRYPENKYEVTGIDYEPWHFRYVGVSVAKYISENNITLEEYLEEYIASIN